MITSLKKDKVIRGFKELAMYLHIGRDSARKLMNTPGFPVIELSPRVRIVSVDALEHWLVTKN